MADGFSIFGLAPREAIPIAISIAALGISVFFSRRASKLSQRHLETTRQQGDEGTKISKLQTKVVHEQTRWQRDSDIIRWAGETVSLLGDMSEMPVMELPEAQRRQRWHDLRARLSTQIDIGRLYFPNLADDAIDPDLPSAFRGRRRAPLEYLVEAYDVFDEEDVLGDLTTRRACKQALVMERRRFISEIQSQIDPGRYEKFLREDAVAELGDGEGAAPTAAPDQR